MNCVLPPENETDEPGGTQTGPPAGALTLFHISEF